MSHCEDSLYSTVEFSYIFTVPRIVCANNSFLKKLVKTSTIKQKTVTEYIQPGVCHAESL